DAVGAYLDAIGRIPLLTVEQERRLARQVQLGREAQAGAADDVGPVDERAVDVGDRAKHELVEANLRLVVSIARRYRTNTNLDLLDLIQAGNLGLWRAVDSFDPERGFRFSTYATRWVKQSIGRTIDKFGSTIHVPIDTSNRVRSALRSMVPDGTSAWRELAQLDSIMNPCSLDEQLGEGRSRAEVVPSTDEGVEAAVLVRERSGTLLASVARLPSTCRAVVVLRYGLDGSAERTYGQIAAALDLSQDEVASALRTARRVLRQAMEEADLVPCPTPSTSLR
ncbi:MAG: hrdD, partial [Actinomycetia bacterium]|nr:hrdD [Actinomycetes bacterium]